MQGSIKCRLTMDDFRAAITGYVCSIIGINLLGLVQDIFMAFLLGGIGALGGWAFNKLIKYIEKPKNGKKP